jgi:hypothetical protein
MERFREYIRTMVGGTDDISLPLTAMNPMAREHVPARLDQWIALGAEDIAAQAAREAESRLAFVDGSFRTGLVISDDVRGGWTNRYTSDASGRFEGDALLRRGWITTILWASEEPERGRLRAAVLGSVYRALHFRRHGRPKTLKEMMTQEGRAALFAGMKPQLSPEDLVRARAVLRPHLDAQDYPTCFAALYGDAAAGQLGYTPLGVPALAGFEVALDDAAQRGEEPEKALS